jgi:hypothetical protein
VAFGVIRVERGIWRKRTCFDRMRKTLSRERLSLGTPNGLEMSRPASQGQYRMKWLTWAGRVGSIELLGRCKFRA